MKKISTAGGKASEELFRSETDDRPGSGRSVELVLRVGRNGRTGAGTEAGYDCESDERSVREDATEPDGVGKGDAFAVGEPGVKRVGTRGLLTPQRTRP
jgi:hypothetical protein